MNSGRIAVADGNSSPSSRKPIRNFEPKKRIWAKANAAIDEISVDSTTVSTAISSEFHSERK